VALLIVPLLPVAVSSTGAATHAAAPAAVAPAAVAIAIPETAKLYFEVGAADLPADAPATLARVIAVVKTNDALHLVVSGFHDASGDPAMNAELAKKRAEAVAEALKAQGVAESRIELKKPEQVNGGDAAEARRVDVTAQ
ncbi:MAG TPA: OmpA family protein, partial [Burkholderiaceae bacterium]|nr:OmpA family protein [Burkholderiaceae bacterium]